MISETAREMLCRLHEDNQELTPGSYRKPRDPLDRYVERLEWLQGNPTLDEWRQRHREFFEVWERGMDDAALLAWMDARDVRDATDDWTFDTGTARQPEPLCSCMDCVDARRDAVLNDPESTARDRLRSRVRGSSTPGWSFGCHLCGNKRCPHHSNHNNACTGSNATGQKGSRWENAQMVLQ